MNNYERYSTRTTIIIRCGKLVTRQLQSFTWTLDLFTFGCSWVGPFKLHTMAREDRIQRTKCRKKSNLQLHKQKFEPSLFSSKLWIMNCTVLNVPIPYYVLICLFTLYTVYIPYVYREYVQNETTWSQKNLYLFHKLYMFFKWPLTWDLSKYSSHTSSTPPRGRL